MEDESIKQQVREYVARELLPGEPIERVTDDLPLISGGIVDSLGGLRLVSFLEEQFGIRFEADETGQENLDSISKIATFIETKTSREP